MSRKIVIRDEDAEPLEEEIQEAEAVEEEKGEELVGEEEQKRDIEIPTVRPGGPAVASPDLESANKEYESLAARMNDLVIRDNVFQRMFRDQDVSLNVVRRILSRWDSARSEIVKDSLGAKNKYLAVKSRLEGEFAKTEEDLYLATIELNTLEIKEKGSKTLEVGAREELEAQIPILRQRLFELRNKIKEVDSRMKELEELPKRIIQRTSSTQIPAELYNEMKEKYSSVYGSRVESILQTNVANVIESEKLNRQYSTILVWKKLKST